MVFLLILIIDVHMLCVVESNLSGVDDKEFKLASTSDRDIYQFLTLSSRRTGIGGIPVKGTDELITLLKFSSGPLT
jgi:hypothetical protein